MSQLKLDTSALSAEEMDKVLEFADAAVVKNNAGLVAFSDVNVAAVPDVPAVIRPRDGLVVAAISEHEFRRIKKRRYKSQLSRQEKKTQSRRKSAYRRGERLKVSATVKPG
jgi:hypothetical protein